MRGARRLPPVSGCRPQPCRGDLPGSLSSRGGGKWPPECWSGQRRRRGRPASTPPSPTGPALPGVWPEPGLTAGACPQLLRPASAQLHLEGHSRPRLTPSTLRTRPTSGHRLAPGKAAPGARTRPRHGPGGRQAAEARARPGAAPSRDRPGPRPHLAGELSRPVAPSLGATGPGSRRLCPLASGGTGGREGRTDRPGPPGAARALPWRRPGHPRPLAHRVPSPRPRPGLRAPLSLGAPGAGRPHGAHGAVAAGPGASRVPTRPEGPGAPAPDGRRRLAPRGSRSAVLRGRRRTCLDLRPLRL